MAVEQINENLKSNLEFKEENVNLVVPPKNTSLIGLDFNERSEII